MQRNTVKTCRVCGDRILFEGVHQSEDCSCDLQREAQWEHIVKTCPHADHEGFCQQREAECSADICPEVEV